VGTYTLRDLFERLTTDQKLRADTDQLRALSGAEQGEAKRALDNVTAGQFRPKLRDDLLWSHSGLAVYDWDNLSAADALDIRALVGALSPTALTHISPRGHGVKAFLRLPDVPTDAKSHRDIWTLGANWLDSVLPVAVDRTGSNVGRRSFLCFDATAILNLEAEAPDAEDWEAFRAVMPARPVAAAVAAAPTVERRTGSALPEAGISRNVDLFRMACKAAPDYPSIERLYHYIWSINVGPGQWADYPRAYPLSQSEVGQIAMSAIKYRNRGLKSGRSRRRRNAERDREIVRLAKQGESQRAIAERLGVSRGSVIAVLKRTQWASGSGTSVWGSDVRDCGNQGSPL